MLLLMCKIMRMSLKKNAEPPVFCLLLVMCVALAPVFWNSFCPSDAVGKITVQTVSHDHEKSGSHHEGTHDSASHEHSSQNSSDGCCSFKADATTAILQSKLVISPQLIRDLSFLPVIISMSVSLIDIELSSSNTYLHYGGRLASSLASIPLYQSLSHYLI